MQDTNALKNLTNAVENFFDRDTVPKVWFICGYTIATMQRQSVMKEEGFFPQLNVFGVGEKTIAAKVGASLVAMHENWSIATKFKGMEVYDRISSLAGAVLILDDPDMNEINADQTSNAVSELIWDVSHGNTRKVRGKADQIPQTNCIITSNWALGGGCPAIESRLLKLYFPDRSVEVSALPALEDAMAKALSTLPTLSAIQYDRSAIRDIERELLKHLAGGDSRIANSMAMITYFTQKFCDASGIDFNAFDYASTHLCPIQPY